MPYAGTWIEMGSANGNTLREVVVPYAGTWIEIFNLTCDLIVLLVVPYAGTWIEIDPGSPFFQEVGSRALRGHVD